MFCPVLWVAKPEVDIGLSSEQDCLKEKCAWWDDSDEHCCIVDIASSLSMIGSFLKDITENGIPRRGG